MKTFPIAALPLLFAALASADQDKTETREVRVYLLDRAAPERDRKDAVAVLTVEQPTGRGRTFLLPRVAKGAPTPGEERAPGMIRGLVGTPYFVEFQTGDAAPAPQRDQVDTPDEQGRKPAPLSGQEVLRRAHRQGVCFTRKIPAELLSAPFTATITIRVGNQTFTSEEFQGPKPSGTPDEVAARADRALSTLKKKADEMAGFMETKPAAKELQRELSQLAPAGFEDGSGDFELHRQWCIALARKIDDACDRGEEARITDLSQQCRPRLKEMQTILARARKEPEPPTEIPTVK